MLTAFTICSNNYLAQAKTLGDSVLKHNPGYQFIIFLVDRLSPDVDYTFFKNIEIIPVEQVGIDGFTEMTRNYNITELNTAVKPSCFSFIFNRNQSVSAVIYLDPDILAYDQFNELDSLLQEYNIVLTPHWFTPIYDQFNLKEQVALNTGMYNLGFLGVRRSKESEKFLAWWTVKLKDLCFIDLKNGLFVDQVWINFVPLYYEKVFIVRHLGYNIAYWNLHERIVQQDNGKYVVSNSFPLKFFHFSGFNIEKTTVISKYQDRYSFENRKDLAPLFENYSNIVRSNKHAEFSKIESYFDKLRNELLLLQYKEWRKNDTLLKRILRFTVRKLVAVTGEKALI